MGFLGWIELISLVLKFPGTVLQVVKLLQKTPAEKHQEIITGVESWMDQSQSGERPTWERP